MVGLGIVIKCVQEVYVLVGKHREKGDTAVH